MIRALSGDDLGVPRIPEASVVEWAEQGRRVVFSYARLGEGITLHFAAGEDALRDIKQAVSDCIAWLFWAYPWCEMVFGIIGSPSIERLAVKCGFHFLMDCGPYKAYVRHR